MRKRLQRLKPDLFIALVLLLLPLAHFAPVVFGQRTLLPADNLLAIEPWRSAAGQFTSASPPVPHNKLLDDLVLENYPWKKFILESLQAGELPLWNPYQFAGVPFLAAGQHSALYPFSAIFYVAPLPRAYGLFIWSQFFLSGLFAYIFLRVLGVRRLAGLFGAIAYQLSLFMVVSVVFPMIVAAAVWLPLVLTAIELAVRQQPALGGRPATLPWLVLGAGALGLQILAGHVEITYHTLLVAAAYSAWRLLAEWRRQASTNSHANGTSTAAARVGRLVRRAAALLGLAAAGLALGAVQLIPLYELVRYNFRSGSATFDQIIGWSYPWRHILHFLVPNFLGNSSHHGYFDLFSLQWRAATVNALGQPIDTVQWGIKNSVEGGAYLGLLPLLLAPLALAHWLHLRRQPPSSSPITNYQLPVTFFALLAALCLTFAFPTRLYALIFWLPGIDQLHSPFRWVWVLSLCSAVLAAFGIEYLCHVAEGAAARAARQQRRTTAANARDGNPILRALCLFAPPSLITALSGLAVWGGALTIIGLLAAWLGYDALGINRLMDFLLADWVKANEAFADGRMFFSYEARWFFQMALLLIASGLVLRLAASRRTLFGRPAWQPLAVAVLALDLIVAGWGFNPAADPAILTYTPPSVEFLRQDASLWRFTSYDPEGDKPYNANAGWYFNFHDVRGYDSIFTQQYMRYMELIQPQFELDFNRIAPISEPGALDSPLLDLLNVKYVVTTAAIDNPKYTLVYDGEVRIYQNVTALPRAFTQPLAATVVSADFGATVQRVDPRQHVIVDSLTSAPDARPVPGWPGPVQDIVYTPSEVYVTASVAGPSWLILADSYFPGWRAYLRPAGAAEDQEQPLEITLVNGNFRGVVVPAGDWTVRFKYSPDSVKLGAVISFIAGMTLVFALAVFIWRYFYRESAVDSTARRVAKNSLAPMALNLVNRAVDLGFAAFMLRVLGPADAGKYYFAIVVFGWFEIITNYGLNTLLTRDVSRDPANANRYLVNTTLLRLALGIVVIPGLAALLALRQVLPSFELPLGLGAFHPDRLTADTLWAITLLVLAQAPATVAIGLSALFYAYEKAEYPAAVSTLTTLAKVSLGTVALVLGFGFVGLAGVSVIVNGLTLVLLGVLAWRLFFPRGLRWEFDPRFQRLALRESFPLMLNNLLATLFFKVDVTLLEPIRGAREVGLYSTAYKFVDAYNIIPSLFTFALFPVMSRQAHEDRPALRRSYTLAVKLLSALALPLAVVTTALAPLMVGLLGGREYLPGGAIALAILVWSIPLGWLNSITNYLLIALDQQRGLTRAFGLALIFNVSLNMLLLPRFGFVAAAAVTIASEFFEGLAFYWYLQRTLGPMPWLRLLWRLWLSTAVMAGAMYALWAVQPALALVAGVALYAAGLYFLRAFTPEEMTVLLNILPARMRRRPTRSAERV